MKNESANVIKHIFSYNLYKTVKLEICKKYISHLKYNRCVLIKKQQIVRWDMLSDSSALSKIIVT